MKKILLVENHQPVIYVAIEAFRVELGTEVYCARNGPGALQMIEAAQFDFAFISVLKDEAGFDVARQAASKDIAVLLTSGNPLAIIKLEMLSYPYLVKPYRIPDLILHATQIMRHPAPNIAAVKASAAKEYMMRTLLRGAANKSAMPNA